MDHEALQAEKEKLQKLIGDDYVIDYESIITSPQNYQEYYFFKIYKEVKE